MSEFESELVDQGRPRPISAGVTPLAGPPTAPVYLHVGLFKAASTTLRTHLFPNHSEIAYLRGSGTKNGVEEVIYDAMKADSTYFDLDAACASLWPLLGPSPPAGKRWFVSINNVMTHEVRDKGLVAARLKAMLPTARIIMILRRQEDLVQSWYLQKLEHLIPINDYIPFDAWAAQQLSKRHKSVFDDIDYYPIIRCYERHFGRENICLLLFEEFARDQARWARQFSAFAGIGLEETQRLLANKHANPRVSKRMLMYGYVRSNFLPRAAAALARRIFPESVQARWYNYWKSGAPVPGGLAPRWAAEVRAIAAAGNARLAAEYGLPLERYGYALPGGREARAGD